RRDPRGARRDERIDGSRVVQVGEQLYLEVRTLGPVLLDEVGFRQRLSQIAREGEAIPGRTWGEADGGQVLPGLVDVFPQVGFRVRRGVGSDGVESPSKVLGRPTG